MDRGGLERFESLFPPNLSVVVLGVKFWNRDAIRRVFNARDVSFFDQFPDALEAAKTGAVFVLWASQLDDERVAILEDAKVRTVYAEDGFVRSVGLGAGLAASGSFAFDGRGIYYDPSHASDLEVLLQTVDFDDASRSIGAHLREMIVAHGVTKYNVGTQHAHLPKSERQRILITGQVADDASIRKAYSLTLDCAGSVNVNRDLLQVVRARYPDAYLIFKPHPDVVAGLRKGHVDDALEYADHVEMHASLPSLLGQVDRVETISSLAGFEALLRGVPVGVHAQPFYAGWGLTDDYAPHERRTRQVSLDELVYTVLCLYCVCIDPVHKEVCSAEQLIMRLADLKGKQSYQLRQKILQWLSWAGRKVGL